MVNPTISQTIYFKKQNNQSKVNGAEAIVIVVISTITLIISIITMIISIVVSMKLNLLPNTDPIQHTENMTLIKNEFIISNKVHLNQNVIKIRDSINGNLSLETPNSYLRLNSDQIEFYAKEKLIFKLKESDEKLFPPDFNKITFELISQLKIPNGLQNVNKIRSPTDLPLEIQANNLLNLKGNNGLKLDGKQINFKSGEILLNSLNSTINFESVNGEIYFRFNKNLNNLNPKKSDLQDLDSNNFQHKLCVCGSNGLVFKLMVKDNLTKCNDVRFPVSNNPCARQSRF